MPIIKQGYNFVNDGPAFRAILNFATGRTPEAAADVDVYGRRPAEICRPLSTTRRAARAYKDFIALTFLDRIYALDSLTVVLS
jgi:hypothetical protein